MADRISTSFDVEALRRLVKAIDLDLRNVVISGQAKRDWIEQRHGILDALDALADERRRGMSHDPAQMADDFAAAHDEREQAQADRAQAPLNVAALERLVKRHDTDGLGREDDVAMLPIAQVRAILAALEERDELRREVCEFAGPTLRDGQFEFAGGIASADTFPLIAAALAAREAEEWKPPPPGDAQFVTPTGESVVDYVRRKRAEGTWPRETEEMSGG